MQPPIMKKNQLVLCFICSINFSAFSQIAASDLVKVFLPGVVSTGYNERDMAISPDGTEMFYTIQAPRMAMSVIVRRTLNENHWSDAEVAPFSGQFSDLEAVFSEDGKKLFFVSNRPIQPGGPSKDYDIWYVEKNKQGWSNPVHAGTQINSKADEYYPSPTSDGSIYFTAERPDALGKEDIYKSQWSNNQFQKPVNIGAGVNSKLDEFNAFVDPHEQYILFGTEGGEGDLGRGDLYISYRNANGTWTKGRNLGSPINSSRLDYCPFVYKETLYFTSERAIPISDGTQKQSLKEMKNKLDSWGNGWGDIYSVPLNSIIQLK